MNRRSKGRAATGGRILSVRARLPGWAAVLLLGTATAAAGQEAREMPAELRTAAEAARVIRSIGARVEEEVWPGFRPDTLAVVFTVPDVGWLLSGWVGDLPPDFTPVRGVPGAGWRGYRPGAPSEENQISFEGRPWISYRSYNDYASELGNGVHEAFHLLQRALRDADRYPPGENSFIVSSYPEFDAVNEAGLALEGRLLSAALSALDGVEGGAPSDTSVARSLARQFVAVREARHRALGVEHALFEARTELNEGVAQYTFIRALDLAVEDASVTWKTTADSAVRAQLAQVDAVLDASRRSVRLRFYASGAAQALLLDALAGPDWKDRLMEEGGLLQDLLAEASGYRAAEARRVADARAAFGADLDRRAAGAVESLREDRARRAEEALAAPGVVLELDAAALPRGDIGFCGIDPQNLLQLGERRLLHARWLRACGPGLDAEFNTQVVHDRTEGRLRAVIGAADQVEVREADGGVVIEAPGLNLRAENASLERGDGRLIVTLLGEGP